jgi:hypothetical protein
MANTFKRGGASEDEEGGLVDGARQANGELCTLRTGIASAFTFFMPARACLIDCDTDDGDEARSMRSFDRSGDMVWLQSLGLPGRSL